jgi:hypothetical protein
MDRVLTKAVFEVRFVCAYPAKKSRSFTSPFRTACHLPWPPPPATTWRAPRRAASPPRKGYVVDTLLRHKSHTGSVRLLGILYQTLKLERWYALQVAGPLLFTLQCSFACFGIAAWY